MSGGLQGLYEAECETPRNDDRDIAEQLRRRGYWVQMLDSAVHGQYTDAYLGRQHTIMDVTRYASEAAKWEAHENECDEFIVTVLNPIDPEEEARLAEELEREVEEYSSIIPDDEIPF